MPEPAPTPAAASLRESLYALNRARSALLEGDPDVAKAQFEALTHLRDQVWATGVDLYGWTD